MNLQENINRIKEIMILLDESFIRNLVNTVKNTSKTSKIAKAGKDISYMRQRIKAYNQEWSDLMNKFRAKEISKSEYINQLNKLNSKHKVSDFQNAIYDRKITINIEKNKNLVLNTPQENILKSKYQLGKNVAGGGSHNLGVFDLGNGYVAKASPSGWNDIGIGNLKLKDKIKSPRVMKTVQVKSFTDANGKEVVYQVQQRATGRSMDKMSVDEIRKIPEIHKQNFIKDVDELERLGGVIDPSKMSNFFYDPAKGIQIIDLGGINTTRTKKDVIIKQVLKK